MSRCVHCGRARENHVDDECYAGERTRFATMDLPEGKTCADCRYVGLCTGLIGDVAGNTHCDWFPVRFSQRATA